MNILVGQRTSTYFAVMHKMIEENKQKINTAIHENSVNGFQNAKLLDEV